VIRPLRASQFEQDAPGSAVDAYRAFMAGVQTNALRYVKMIAEVADDQLASMQPTVDIEEDVVDVMVNQVSPEQWPAGPAPWLPLAALPAPLEPTSAR
jgi:hypothetical protein